MGVRLENMRNRVPNGGPEIVDTDLVTKETTVDGMTFAWGPSQVRNFADDGVGIAHAAFDGAEATVEENGEFASGNTGNLNPTRT